MLDAGGTASFSCHLRLLHHVTRFAQILQLSQYPAITDLNITLADSNMTVMDPNAAMEDSNLTLTVPQATVEYLVS
jgi:hypothetical protein